MDHRPRTRVPALIATVIAVASVLSACEESHTKTTEADPIPVVVATAERKAVPFELVAVGTVEPINSVQVKSQVDGQLLSAEVADGQEVKAGDLLFRIDPRPIQARIEQAKATLDRDRAQLHQARAQLQRYGSIATQGFVSKDELAQVQTNEEVAVAALAVDQAALDGLQLQLEFTEIRAPIAGRAGRVLVQPGNLVKADDTTPLVVINQLSPIYVSFALPQSLLGRVRGAHSGNDPLAVTARAEGVAATERGELAFVDNAVDTSTGTVRMRARFDNASHALWPGLFVDVRLNLGAAGERVVVPDAAVSAGPDGSYVFLVRDGKVEQRTVTVERSQGGVSLIEEGVEEGDNVVVDGQSRLRDGIRVAIASPAP
jgi:multidrug efflux system membrane fusion protein